MGIRGGWSGGRSRRTPRPWLAGWLGWDGKSTPRCARNKPQSRCCRCRRGPGARSLQGGVAHPGPPAQGAEQVPLEFKQAHPGGEQAQLQHMAPRRAPGIGQLVEPDAAGAQIVCLFEVGRQASEQVRVRVRPLGQQGLPQGLEQLPAALGKAHWLRGQGLRPADLGAGGQLVVLAEDPGKAAGAQYSHRHRDGQPSQQVARPESRLIQQPSPPLGPGAPVRQAPASGPRSPACSDAPPRSGGAAPTRRVPPPTPPPGPIW